MGTFMVNWSARDRTLPRALSLGHPGFVTERDLFTQAELDEDEVYRGFFRKHGLDYRAGTIIPMPVGDSIAITIFRNGRQGPVQAEHVSFLDSLRPHLARASLTANRLGFERARAMTDALATLGLPAAVLRDRGVLLAANPLFEALMPTLVQDRADRLKLTNLDADELLMSALVQMAHGHRQPSVNSIPVAALEGFPPMIFHLLPVRGAAHDVFSQAAALLIATPVDRAAVPTAQVLQGLFDLTPAESRLAGLIGLAQTPREAALGLGISEENARTTLKRIFSKTGTRRQAELVRLLSGSALGPAEPR